MPKLTKPVLVVGVGGAGSRLALQAREALSYDTLLVSNDERDLDDQCPSLKISTESEINPTVQRLRWFTLKESQKIKKALDGYASVVIMCNLAGRAGAAVAPIVSHIAGERNTSCFAIMPFGYEKGKIFSSGVALKRLRGDSDFVVVVDNDAVMKSNPALTPVQCKYIANSALLHAASSLGRFETSGGLGVASAGRFKSDLEESLQSSLKMLCGATGPGRVRRSIIHVMGGDNVPVSLIESIQSMTEQVLGERAQIEIETNSSDEFGIVMVSAVQGTTRFDAYDPLGMIPTESYMDWEEPDCEMDCSLGFYQME